MNERIKKLLVKSGLLINVSEHRVNELDPNIEKFAELLIKECIQQVEKDLIPDEEIIEGYNEDWNSALEFAAKQIKEHFLV